MIYYTKKRKFAEFCKKQLHLIKKKYLIVGIGINTNINPKTKAFINVIKKYNKKNIDNKKILKKIQNK